MDEVIGFHDPARSTTPRRGSTSVPVKGGCSENSRLVCQEWRLMKRKSRVGCCMKDQVETEVDGRQVNVVVLKYLGKPVIRSAH